MSSSTIRHYAGAVGALSRSREPDDPDLVEARTRLRIAKIEESVRQIVDAAPPLTSDQRERLAMLLRGGAT